VAPDRVRVSRIDLGADPIDHLVALDPGRRGIARFFTPGAARRAAGTLQRARRVLIATGFVVAPGRPETDGPPGAAVLGRALRLLGADVRHVTDAVTAPVLAAALAALGEPKDVIVYPAGADAARQVLVSERPSHLVSIERPGRARSGDYLNMRGESVAALNAPLDEIFVLARRMRRRSRAAPRTGHRPSEPASRFPLQIGVGDGGNEIGMGNVRARIVRGGGVMARIVSVVRVDHLVVAGVSNWGAYGIVAGLSEAAARPLLHTVDDERRMVRACVEAGACDGVTRRPEPTVDGLGLDVHAAWLTLLSVAAGPRA
jgi:hypothetical protein